MQTPRLLGYIPDAPDDRDRRFGASPILASPPLTGAASYDYRHLDSPRVQLGNSCVGQSIAAAAYLAMRIAGTPITFPSALLPYTGARLIGDPPKLPGEAKLSDWGCSPRYAMLFAREHGMVAEERWRESSDTINAVPPLDVWQEGECAQLESFYRIPDGAGSSDAIREALRRGYCPFFGMQIDERYDQIGSRVYDAPGGKQRGGHCQVLVGWIDVLGAFVVRNSWGRGFGDEGYAYVSASFIDHYSTDKWVIRALPEVR
ncbi:MAG TPA: C1 family peptidase [Labilithrix sp.]|nr:C1 family peptidase [Labilithrix sp.]